MLQAGPRIHSRLSGSKVPDGDPFRLHPSATEGLPSVHNRLAKTTCGRYVLSRLVWYLTRFLRKISTSKVTSLLTMWNINAILTETNKEMWLFDALGCYKCATVGSLRKNRVKELYKWLPMFYQLISVIVLTLSPFFPFTTYQETARVCHTLCP